MQQIYDDDYGVKELIELCTKRAADKGWHDTTITFSDAIALMHTELSEAYEEYRKHHDYNETYYDQGHIKPEGIPIELADLAIRLFHYCGYFKINLMEAIRLKMEYNSARPYRHGNKKS
jgi:NTP pyrophosphatase (non-canonical NTP hydrolase)